MSARFLDDFDGPGLDREVWIPHYLPQWSSRAASAATLAVERSRLRLTIPPEQGVWCADTHEPPLRVSGIQSGVVLRAGRGARLPGRAADAPGDHVPVPEVDWIRAD